MTDAHWLESPAGRLSVRLSRPTPGSGTGLGVVLLPPFGYELSSSYRTLRRFADALAASGVLVLRVDYAGTGDSAGRAADVTLGTLRETLPVCVAALRGLGISRVVAAGLRLGGLLAMLDAGRSGVDEVLAWAPVLPGTRYPRELSLLGEQPAQGSGLDPEDRLVAGFHIPAALLTGLRSLTLDDIDLDGVGRLVVGERDDKPVAAKLQGLALQPEVVSTVAMADVLDVAAEDSVIPGAAIEALVATLTQSVPGSDAQVAPCDWPTRASVAPGVTEEHVVIGDRGTVGVMTRAGGAPGATLVLLNSGSDPHHGPARAWVDLARLIASHDIEVLRMDFSGWGDSPDDERATGRPYDLHVVDDIVEVSRALHEAGGRRVVFAGLCAGAWVALHAARVATVDEVIALNPQLYWQPGHPVEARMSDTRLRRAAEIAHIAEQAEAGVFDEEDAAGIVCGAGRWLQGLADARVPVTLLFAEGDDGLVYLRQRMGRRLQMLIDSNGLTVRELPGVDHSLSRLWMRPTVAEVIRAAVG